MLLMKNKVKTGGFLDNLKKRERVLNGYSDEYIGKVVRNLYSSSDTYIIKVILCEFFMSAVSDRVVDKFLAVIDNVNMDEFIEIYI